jgi:uncharacterized membrane protein (UPF0127 family)
VRIGTALVIAALVSACGLPTGASAAPPVIPLKLPSKKVLQVELMANNQDRAMGLMFRRSLPMDRGLLFVFDEPGNYPFWMKNCRFPIDMVWLDENRKVVYVAENVPPCAKDPCPNYGGMQRSLYVVEMNARQARAEGVMLGSVLEFKLPAR